MPNNSPKKIKQRSRSLGKYRRRPGLIHRTTASAALIFACGIATAQSQGLSWDPRTTFCQMTGQVSTIASSTLFVDGGEWMPNQYFTNGTDKLVSETVTRRLQNEFLWRLDLSKTFQANKPPWEIEQKPPSHTEHYNGAFATIWNIDDGNFTTVGGWFSLLRGPPPATVFGSPIITPISGSKDMRTFQLPKGSTFTYNTKTRKWSSVPFEENTQRISSVSYGVSVRNRLGFTIGGEYVNEGITEYNATVSLPSPIKGGPLVDTMTTYNFKTGEYKLTLPPDELRQSSHGHFLNLDRVGKEGVMAFVGGKQRLTNGTTRNRDLDKIYLYDVGSESWFSQAATGDIPIGRHDTCMIVVPAPDQSSYQLYMFSGLSDEKVANIYNLDLYVLTLPAFIWVKIPIEGYRDTWGVGAHACALYSSRQMLISGGARNASSNAAGTGIQIACDTTNQLSIFDVEEWKFKSTFDPNIKGSKVPSGIVKIIGGNSDGGATLTQPKAGFNSTELKDIFAIRNELIDFGTNNNNTNGTDTGNGTKSSGNPEEKPNHEFGAGKIAGAVVGGVFGLALIVCLAVLWKRSKNREHRPAELASSSTGQTRRSAEELGGNPLGELYAPDPNAYKYEMDEGRRTQEMG
ncbi:hypothetical protein DFH27DRAFT_550107 [Peziza echinospora]|nr:hypothetical protein DFH27DRAFT_550107 [Peziza echinospora]